MLKITLKQLKDTYTFGWKITSGIGRFMEMNMETVDIEYQRAHWAEKLDMDFFIEYNWTVDSRLCRNIRWDFPICVRTSHRLVFTLEKQFSRTNFFLFRVRVQRERFLALSAGVSINEQGFEAFNMLIPNATHHQARKPNAQRVVSEIRSPLKWRKLNSYYRGSHRLITIAYEATTKKKKSQTILVTRLFCRKIPSFLTTMVLPRLRDHCLKAIRFQRNRHQAP